MSRIRGGLCVIGAAVVLAAPSSATGAEVIGQTGAGACADNRAYTQALLSGGPSYSPSAYGVITSWSGVEGAGTVTRQMKLLVLRPNPSAGPSHFIATQKDQARTFTQPSALNVFTGLRLPIEANEQIGVFLPDGQLGGAGPCAFMSVAGNTMQFPLTEGEPALNASVDYPSVAGDFRVNASAVVEPDTDRDVFGDETQDNCIGTAGTVAGCPNTVTLGKATAKGNTVTVPATIPGAGTLKGGSATDPTLLAATAAKKKKKKKKPQPPLTQSSQTLSSKTRQTVTLTLNLSKAGKANLARKGKLGLSIKVLYTPTGGTAGAATSTAKLTKKKRKKKKG